MSFRKSSSDECGWYPVFSAWMQEVRPGSSLEDGQIATWEMLEPIVRRRFVEARVAFVDTDIDDCRDEVFRRIEEKLRRQEFPVNSLRCCALN